MQLSIGTSKNKTCNCNVMGVLVNGLSKSNQIRIFLDMIYQAKVSLVHGNNKTTSRPSKSFNQLRNATQHHPWNQERANNLSILNVCRAGEFSRVAAN